ncbi:carboxymuconolactone decarboxylase family protein [Fructilactobacillus sp. Tb1]|uniref:carboxymuconolactone decarboxylase family protein n=1 Tax=Fructilactobacillus sp. Tb1 TaxID=3422304 RepID=UPI003D2B0145
MKKQTAGHDLLGDFAPKFAELNDDVLFGQVWSRTDKLSERERIMITMACLQAQGAFPQLEHHMQHAKEFGITKDEMVEMITQLAFYGGWPKAWSAMNLAKKIYKD